MSNIKTSPVTEAATAAVYVYQFNTAKAARHVCSEVPGTPYEDAVAAITAVAKVQRSGKK